MRRFFWLSSRLPTFGRGGLGLFVLLLLVLSGSGLAGDAAAVEERRYPAYSDPEKPVVSHVLSSEENVTELQERFSLSDKEVDAVLRLVREENEALSRARGESQEIVESNQDEGASREQTKQEITASGYDALIEVAVSRTKNALERTLPKGRQAEFKAWVEEAWQQERREFNEGSAGQIQATASGRWYEVFTTQYNGYTSFEVALPHRKLKFAGGYEVYLEHNGREVWAPVKEVGPWNTYDNWWAKNRTMWKSLPRGVPEAEAAYYNNYNKGRDEFGRKVLNPAGVDVTPAVAKKLGLGKYENAWIWVWIPWAS